MLHGSEYNNVILEHDGGDDGVYFWWWYLCSLWFFGDVDEDGDDDDGDDDDGDDDDGDDDDWWLVIGGWWLMVMLMIVVTMITQFSVICFDMVWFGFNVFVDDYFLFYSNGLFMLVSFEQYIYNINYTIVYKYRIIDIDIWWQIFYILCLVRYVGWLSWFSDCLLIDRWVDSLTAGMFVTKIADQYDCVSKLDAIIHSLCVS